MKIEMGESLGASWMKHEKGCHVVQTNWKVSPETKWENLDRIQGILDELKVVFGTSSVDIFGKDNAAQIVRQTECDVLGVNLLPDGAVNVYALEVAIHLKGDGLHYSGTKHANPAKKVNVSDDKVVAKLFGIAMTIFSTMGKTGGEISFAAPIVRDDLLAVINSRLNLLETVLSKHGFSFAFRMYANQDFYMKILRRVLSIADNVSDTNELFLRAMQIYLASASRWAPELQGGDGNGAVGLTEDGECSTLGSTPHNNTSKAHGKCPTYNVIVNGNVFSVGSPMGAAARDVVRAYVEYTSDVTFNQLRVVFPRSAHGSREVVVVETDDLDTSRYSLPVVLADGTSVLVTNQWCGAGPRENWQHFRDHVAGLDREDLSIRIERSEDGHKQHD